MSADAAVVERWPNTDAGDRARKLLKEVVNDEAKARAIMEEGGKDESESSAGARKGARSKREDDSGGVQRTLNGLLTEHLVIGVASKTGKPPLRRRRWDKRGR